MYNYTMVKKGDFYRLIPLKNSSKMATPIIVGTDGQPLNAKSERVVTQVITLKHVSSDVVRPLFRYVSNVSAPQALADKKTLVITAAESELEYFQSILKVFDVPSDVPYIQSYDLVRAIPSQVRTNIQNYFTVEQQRTGVKKNSEKPFLLADDSTSRLLVSAIKSDHQIVEDFIAFFDQDVTETTTFRPIEIYRLKNAKAEEIAKKLDQVLKSRKGNSSKDPKAKKEDIPTIVPFEQLNALIISVEESETFRYVKDVIDMLDVKRKQVYISSTIVEVSNSNSFDFGATFGVGKVPGGSSDLGLILGGDVGGAGTITYDATGSTLSRGVTLEPNLGSGLTAAIPYGSLDYIPMVLQAAETDSNINVLATPSIVCDDNEHAVIEITEERQFNTTTTNSSTSNTSFGGFNEAGIVLDIKPTISSDNFLKLEITQNVDRFTSDPGEDQVRQKRKATTVVTMPNRTSVVIGGLTQSNSDNRQTAIPVLHKIPVLGNLFKSKSDSANSNTLYFFITPEIITNFDELGDITNRLYSNMERDTDDNTRNHPDFKSIDNRKRKEDDLKKASIDNDLEASNPLPLLKSVFTDRSLSKWVIQGEAQNFAHAIITNRGKFNELLPDYTQPFFNEVELDMSFVETLSRARDQILLFPVERQIEIVNAFNLHLVGELEKVHATYNIIPAPSEG
jgi:general secretion pathway protein D